MEFWNGSIDAGMRRRSDGGEAGVIGWDRDVVPMETVFGNARPE